MVAKPTPGNLDALHRTMDEELEKKFRADDTVKALLTNARKQYVEVPVEILGTVVKVKPVIPKGVRHYVEDLRAAEEPQKIEEAEASTYRLLAAMCVEEPYDRPEFWKVIDDETGIATGLLNRFYEAATETAKEIKSFR